MVGHSRVKKNGIRAGWMVIKRSTHQRQTTDLESLRLENLSFEGQVFRFSNATRLQDVSLMKCYQKSRWPTSVSVSRPVSWPNDGDETGEDRRIGQGVG
jgi:hypothetical protein